MQRLVPVGLVPLSHFLIRGGCGTRTRVLVPFLARLCVVGKLWRRDGLHETGDGVADSCVQELKGQKGNSRILPKTVQ